MAVFPLRIGGTLGIVAALTLLVGTEAAWARRTLQPFASALLYKYAAAVRQGEIAIVETDSANRARQITLLGFAAAPPALVYALVADPLLYPRYVRNLTRSESVPQADGSLRNHWRLSFPIGSFEGNDEVRPLPAQPGASAGAVEMRSLDDGKEGVSRWEFLPVVGGGTLVVLYGYYDPLDNAFLKLLIGQDPALDAGFNLAGALVLMRGLLAESAHETAKAGVRIGDPPVEKAPDFGPLLARGTVAIVRTGAEGKLTDISVVERIAAPLERLESMVQRPELWPRFLRLVKRVEVKERDATGAEYELTVGAVLSDEVTSFRTLFVPRGADTLAISGAIKGARFRWDFRPDGEQATYAIWRGNLHLADSSRLMRTMLGIEPSFEHSANISFGLTLVRSLAAQAH